MDIPFWPDIVKRFSHLKERASDVGRYLMVLEPVPPYNRRGIVTVMITAVSLISITMLAGVSLACLAVLFLAMGLILLILTRILGIDLGVNPEEIFGF